MSKFLWLPFLTLLMLAMCPATAGNDPPSENGTKYGKTLIAEFTVPAATIDKFNRHISDKTTKKTIWNSDSWASPLTPVTWKNGPYRLVVTLTGKALHDGDVKGTWFAGWGDEHGASTTNPLPEFSKRGVKQGESISLTVGLAATALSEDKPLAAVLTPLSLDNFRIESARVQIWAGVGDFVPSRNNVPFLATAALSPLLIFALWWFWLRPTVAKTVRTSPTLSPGLANGPQTGAHAARSNNASERNPVAEENAHQRSAPVVSYREAFKRIVPLVRSSEAGAPASPETEKHDISATTAANGMSAAIREGELPIMRTAGDLVVTYTEDLGDRFRYISEKRMQAFGLTADTLHDLALRNLAARVGGNIRLHGESPRYMITCGGNFEAALLLYDKLWDSLADKLPGKPMAAIPSHDQLFVTGSDWEDAYRFLHERAQQKPADERLAVSRTVFIRKNGRWVETRGAL